MRILVTGASGFLGRTLVRRLADRGHDVFAVHRSALAGGVGTPVLWDFNDESPPELPSAIDAIIHTAQCRNYRSFPAKAGEIFRVNVASTAALLECAARIGIARFCLISSGSIYEPYDSELTEEIVGRPREYYAASKLAAEIIARPYAGILRLAVMRLFFPYGPGQSERLIPNIAKSIRNGDSVLLTSDGEGMIITPTYIGDIAEIVIESVVRDWDGAFNIAAPEEISIRRLAEMIGKELGIAPRFELTQGKAIAIHPNLSRLRERIDLGHLMPINEGLRRTFAGSAD